MTFRPDVGHLRQHGKFLERNFAPDPVAVGQCCGMAVPVWPGPPAVKGSSEQRIDTTFAAAVPLYFMEPTMH